MSPRIRTILSSKIASCWSVVALLVFMFLSIMPRSAFGLINMHSDNEKRSSSTAILADNSFEQPSGRVLEALLKDARNLLASKDSTSTVSSTAASISTPTPTKTSFQGLLLTNGISSNFAYAADPNALAVNGTIYVFLSTDPPFADQRTRYSKMREYSLITTTSMDENTTWNYHGVILSPSADFSDITREYIGKLMFAPAAAYVDGWFYLYFPFLINQVAPAKVGVARSRTPMDRKSWELVTVSMRGILMFDPAVMQDTDGKFYLYGNSRRPKEGPRDHRMIGAPLGPSMAQLAPGYSALSQIQGGFITEAVFTFWRRNPTTNSIVYYFIARHRTGNNDFLVYTMSSTPLPNTRSRKRYRLTPNQFDAPAHASVVEFEGKYYIFYHSGLANQGNQWRRSACVDELRFLPNGRIPTVTLSCPYLRTRAARNKKSNKKK